MINMKRLLLLLLLLSCVTRVSSQNVSLKSNVIDDAFQNVNLGLEIGLAPKWSLDIPASLNMWDLSHGRKWKHVWVQPGARYWFCDRFDGHFIGFHAHGGIYNIGGINVDMRMLGTDFRKLKDTRYQGWFIGGGISYGYAWVLGEHWNLEAEIGVGYSYTRYDRFRCSGCGLKIEENQPHHYVGPTKAAINLVYLF